MAHLKWTALLAAGLALGAVPAGVLADDGEGEDGSGRESDGGGGGGNPGTRPGRGGGRHGRLGDDVRVKLSLGDRREGTPTAKIRLKNRGRNFQSGVLVALHAQTETGEVLGSWTVDIASGGTADFRLPVAPPAGTTVLVATASLDGIADQNPGDNVSRASIGPTGSPGSTGDAAVGASIYAANCASCHGAAAEGSASGPRIAGAPAGEIGEAIREGEGGMPTFPGLTSADVRALAAFLRSPGTVPAPTPSPTPTPTPTPAAPTYTGAVKALLDANCGSCHSGSKASAGLRFDTFANASTNAARALASVEAGRMPKAGPLPAAGVQILRDWIAGGKKQ